MHHYEDNLQMACVSWFRLQYPKYRKYLFHIPNGGRRNIREAARLKKMGTMAGVSDLMLAVPRRNSHGLFIELKIKPNKPTKAQNIFMDNMIKMLYNCKVVYSFDDFKSVINEYLGPSNESKRSESSAVQS